MTQMTAALIWAAGIVVWTIIRWPHRRKARRMQTVTDKRSTMERISLGLTILGLVILPALHLSTGLFEFANTSFWSSAGWLGLVAMIAFLYLFYRSHKDLARNWSVSLEIRKDHQLVDTGVYKNVRHPMYASFWLWGIAQFLLIPNWIAGLSGLFSIAVLYFSRIGAEERMMHQQFGAAYEEYCRNTYRLIPKLF
ncbi:MAG: isoprenylcysteine carboxylmethyltransferase family protein [Rhizobiaceae bacterium]|nr:isoprenylcysteine carboxylmethyltransferase family protein [Rhizobiaceae bacterium]